MDISQMMFFISMILVGIGLSTIGGVINLIYLIFNWKKYNKFWKWAVALVTLAGFFPVIYMSLLAYFG